MLGCDADADVIVGATVRQLAVARMGGFPLNIKVCLRCEWSLDNHVLPKFEQIHERSFIEHVQAQHPESNCALFLSKVGPNNTDESDSAAARDIVHRVPAAEHALCAATLFFGAFQ